MLENVERYLKISPQLPEFLDIHKNKEIFIFTVNYDWLKFCLSSSLILSKRGCLIDLFYEKTWDFNNVPQNYVKKTYQEKIQPFKKRFRDKRINFCDLDDYEIQKNEKSQSTQTNDFFTRLATFQTNNQSKIN